jgi:putative DNA primase/helicase
VSLHPETTLQSEGSRQQRRAGERERAKPVRIVPIPTPDRIPVADKFALLYELLRNKTEGAFWLWTRALFGPDMRYVSERQQWFIWDGRRWMADRANASRERVKAAARAIMQMIPLEEDRDKQKAMLEIAHRFDNINTIKRVLEYGTTDPAVTKSMHDFDREPWYLNFSNGTLDLRTEALLVHDRQHELTLMTDIQYDSTATAPVWEAFLSRVCSHPELVKFLQRAVGYTLTGTNREHRFFLLYGCGRNGKSTFVETILALLGEYAQSSNPETWLRQSGGRGAEPDIARLPGIRMVTTAEIGEGRAMDEPRVKAIVGGDRTTTRDLYRSSFDFSPVCKLWISTNHAPQIRGNDEGMWRRVCMVPFDETIAYEEMDRDLPRKLRAELPGILAWAVRGCIEWQRDGLLEPDVVRIRTSEYRSDQDVLGQFIDECCDVDPAARESVSALVTAYADWARQRGERRSFSATAFGRRLAERGFGAEKIGGRVYRNGIALRHLEVGDGAY